MKTGEYFIGLKKDSESGEWRWISDNSKVDAIKREGKFPWAGGEPSGGGNCAVMYKDYGGNIGKYNDLKCADKMPIFARAPLTTLAKRVSYTSYSFSFDLLRVFFFSNRKIKIHQIQIRIAVYSSL